MDKAEKDKTSKYASFLRSIAPALPHPADNIFNALSIKFVPAAMSIYGSLGTSFLRLLKQCSVSALPVRISPFARPAMNIEVLPPSVWQHIMLGRFKSLTAAAYTRAVGQTLSGPATRRSRPFPERVWTPPPLSLPFSSVFICLRLLSG